MSSDERSAPSDSTPRRSPISLPYAYPTQVADTHSGGQGCGAGVYGWSPPETIDLTGDNSELEDEDVPFIATIENTQTRARSSSSQTAYPASLDHDQTSRHGSPASVRTRRSAAETPLQPGLSSSDSALAGPPPQPASPSRSYTSMPPRQIFIFPVQPIGGGPGRSTYRHGGTPAKKKRKPANSEPSSADESSCRTDIQSLASDVQQRDKVRNNKAAAATKRRSRKTNWLEELRKQLPRSDAHLLSENGTLRAAGDYIAELKREAVEARHWERRYIATIDRYESNSESTKAVLQQTKALLKQARARLQQLQQEEQNA